MGTGSSKPNVHSTRTGTGHNDPSQIVSPTTSGDYKQSVSSRSECPPKHYEGEQGNARGKCTKRTEERRRRRWWGHGQAHTESCSCPFIERAGSSQGLRVETSHIIATTTRGARKKHSPKQGHHTCRLRTRNQILSVTSAPTKTVTDSPPLRHRQPR